MAAITFRLATDADAPALARLAGRDSAPVPAPPVLLAEVAGVPAAARSLRDGRSVADPFRPTSHFVRALAAVAPSFAGPPDRPSAPGVRSPRRALRPAIATIGRSTTLSGVNRPIVGR